MAALNLVLSSSLAMARGGGSERLRNPSPRQGAKNRDRLLAGDVAARFLAAVLSNARVKRLPSSEHFSVDGTLIEAWASMKSFRRKDGSGEPPADGGPNAEVNFRGEVRSNATHASTTEIGRAHV